MKLHTENRSVSLTRTGVMRRAALYGAAPSMPVRNSAYVPQKAVGSFVPKITKQAFEKFGFPAAALLTDWPRIAGADLAGYTVPERLKWSRKTNEASDSLEAGTGQPGATLVLRVDPARALDIEYKSRLLIDRVNAYFGYRAVAAIRIVQGQVDLPAVSVSATPVAAVVAAPKASVADPLSAALDRLGAHVRCRKTG